jgi:uncharacterized protein with HEPN domain
MRPDERDTGYLLDMLRHARGVIRAVAGKKLEDYLVNEDLRLAVERRIEIIGEAARRVSAAFRRAHPQVPWQRIIAQRNVLTHEYGEIQDDILWNVATLSVPELVSLLEPLVAAPAEQ